MFTLHIFCWLCNRLVQAHRSTASSTSIFNRTICTLLPCSTFTWQIGFGARASMHMSYNLCQSQLTAHIDRIRYVLLILADDGRQFCYWITAAIAAVTDFTLSEQSRFPSISHETQKRTFIHWHTITVNALTVPPRTDINFIVVPTRLTIP